MAIVKNTFGYSVGNIQRDVFSMKVTKKNYFRGGVDGWLLDHKVIDTLREQEVTGIKLFDAENNITYLVSLKHFLERCQKINSKHGELYILPTGRFDSIDPKQHNWPIPYA